MENKPYFSIIIPTYNRAELIGKTISSVLEQSFQNFEVIVVDDGSTDNTEEQIRCITTEKLAYFKKKNEERSTARNYGMDRAQGEYITFLDSDDLLYPQHLQNAIEAINKHVNPAFLHLGYEITDKKGRPKTKVNYLRDDDVSIFVKGNPLSCLGIFLRKDVAAKYRFREVLSGPEDWELWIRIAATHGLKTDNRISAALVDHDSRGMRVSNEIRIAYMKNLAIHYMFQDKAVKEKFSPFMNQIIAHSKSFAALHSVLAGNSRNAVKYLYQAIIKFPGVILQKRFFVIIKYLALNAFHKNESRENPQDYLE
ncbi:MAG: glycosyltransferase family 2 protein [Bacteroidota bacterium]